MGGVLTFPSGYKTSMPSLLKLPVGPRDHRRGPDDAQLTLVEYGDFECPQCARAYPIIERLQVSMGDRLRFVFRHFPLTNSHPHAQRAAETAEWAATHGEEAFWRMYHALFEASDKLSDRQLVERAAALGLPSKELEPVWAAHSFIPRVKEQFLGGVDSGVTGTPGFFINGVRHEGSWDEVALTRALETAAHGDQRSG
jgi:protein-disulfide isomerase